MKAACLSLALTALLGVTAMHAQHALPSDPCSAMPTAGTPAAKNFLTFAQFDKELRIALTRRDPVALAFLVKFPLLVNDARGSISLNDAGTLKAYFDEVFTPAVRKEILGEHNDDVGCNEEGIGYARGVIWVNASDRGYAIWSVNRDAVPSFSGMGTKPDVKYVCQTLNHRIVIDILPGGTLRYRAWNKPRLVTEAPDLELTKGNGTFEGTQICAVPVYTFTNGSTVYRISGGLGCTGDADGTPKEATGELEITAGDKRPVDLWCY